MVFRICWRFFFFNVKKRHKDWIKIRSVESELELWVCAIFTLGWGCWNMEVMNHNKVSIIVWSLTNGFGAQENCYQTRASQKPWIARVPKIRCMNSSGVRPTGVFDFHRIGINPSSPFLGPKIQWCPVKKTLNICNLKYRILNSQWPNESTCFRQ